MLEAQSNTPLRSEDLNVVALVNDINVSKKKLSELKIPFIYFFESAVKSGLFKKLGDIEEIKGKCSVYSGFIDRWLAKSIKNKDISILKDGVIEPGATSLLDQYTIDNEKESCEVLGNINNKITEIALKDIGSNKLQGLSSCNFYALKNHPDILLEYRVAFDKFMQSLFRLSDKSAKLENIDGTVHYVGISTCTVDKEVLNEM